LHIKPWSVGFTWHKAQDEKAGCLMGENEEWGGAEDEGVGGGGGGWFPLVWMKEPEVPLSFKISL
jgi:hypothetical protein